MRDRFAVPRSVIPKAAATTTPPPPKPSHFVDSAPREPTPPALPEADPRDLEVQRLVSDLIAAFAFREAEAVLTAYRKQGERQQRTHLEDVFLSWSTLPPDTRPDFLTYAHHRRRPQLAGKE